jgi:membrane protein required for colicin V production
MEALGLTLVDWAIIAIMLFSGLMGFSTGLVHGLLFIASWVGAALLAWRFREKVQPFVMEYVADESIAYFATLLGLFVVALIAFTLVAGVIGRLVRKSLVGGVDRLLGFGFGLICGAAVLSAGYLAFVYIYKDGPLIATVEQARFFPWVKRGAAIVEPYVPEQFRRGRSGEPAPPPAAPAPAPAPSRN